MSDVRCNRNYHHQYQTLCFRGRGQSIPSSLKSVVEEVRPVEAVKPLLDLTVEHGQTAVFLSRGCRTSSEAYHLIVETLDFQPVGK